MGLITDPINNLTFGGTAPLSRATNNANSFILDTQQYVGKVAVRVQIGVKTAGDNDGTVSVQLRSSADNTAANAVNVAGTYAVNTTNNTAASGTIVFDKRAELRYLFAYVVLAGTNSPAYPVAIATVGTKKVQ
jgi:hypothetical protein